MIDIFSISDAENSSISSLMVENRNWPLPFNASSFPYEPFFPPRLHVNMVHKHCKAQPAFPSALDKCRPKGYYNISDA